MVATTPDAEFFRALELRRTRAIVARDMADVRYRAKLTFPAGKVVDCWHTDVYAIHDGDWKAV